MVEQEQKYGTKVEFLGGNNEYRIGASSILFEHSEPGKPTARILVDDGAMFPPDWIDYDSAIPDMRPYFENPYAPVEKPIDALFISHCHEDHIGALAFLAAAKFKLPTIYTSEYTANIIKQQMKNNNVPPEYVPQIEVIREGETVEIGDNMKVSPFNVSHSTAFPLGFHISTTYEGKDLYGGSLPGDYHLDKVPFGPGFDEENFKKFMPNLFINCIFHDSTAGSTNLVDENGEREIPDFKKAVENTLRDVQQHPDKQVFSPVIARSISNLAIDIRVAAETGRTVLIASRGLRQAVKSLFAIMHNKEQWIKDEVTRIKKEVIEQQKEEYRKGSKVRKVIANEDLLIKNVRMEANMVTELMRLSNGEMLDLEKVIYNAHDVEHSDIEKYLRLYTHEQRYMIISGAMFEDKNGHKSTLMLMSEQNKVTRDKDGHIKGKGMTGHPLFTVDDRTLLEFRQRFIESIIGEKYKAPIARWRSNGAVVNITGDDIDTKLQRPGHATVQEDQKLRQLTVENCKNHEDIKNGQQIVYDVAVHGDTEQLAVMSKNLQQYKGYQGKPLLCFNSDVVIFTPDGVYKEKGKTFAEQQWLGVKARSLTGSGNNNLLAFDLCDHNLMQKEHLFTVMNVSARKGDRIDSGYIKQSIVENAQKLEDLGRSVSNAEIRISQQSKGHDFRRGEQTRMTYQEYMEYSKTKKGKSGRGGRLNPKNMGKNIRD